MLTINQDGVLKVFGVCDFGVFAITPSKSIVLIDDENEVEEVASTTTQFYKLFHLIVHANIAPELSENLTEELIDREAKAGSRLWKESFYALTDGFAAPNRYLLTPLKDGTIKSVI